MKKLTTLTLIIAVFASCMQNLSAQVLDTVQISFGNPATTLPDGWHNAGYSGSTTYGDYAIDVTSSWYTATGGYVSGFYPDVIEETYMFRAAANTGATIGVSGISTSFVRAYLYCSSNTGSYEQIIKVNGIPIDTIDVYNNNQLVSLGAISTSGGSLQISTQELNSSDYSYINALVLYTFDSTATPYDYSQVVDTLVNHSNATQEAKELYTNLRNVYGKKILSGYTGHSASNAGSVNSSYYWDCVDSVGEHPLIYGLDLNSLTVGYAFDWSNAESKIVFGLKEEDHQIDTAIARHNAGNILAISWHWYAPSGGRGPNDTVGARGEVAQSNTFNHSPIEYTQFSPATALIEGTEENTWLLEDLDTIAYQLKRLQDLNIPVLWRPLHEAEGDWFWWGRDGVDTWKSLWNLMYDRFVNYHGLNNLIWVNAGIYPSLEWVPDLDKVDIHGFDNYPGEYNYNPPQVNMLVTREQTNHTKMISYGESGPIADVQKSYDQDFMYSYYMSWSYESSERMNTWDHQREMYANPLLLSLEDGWPLLEEVETEISDSIKISFGNGADVDDWVGVVRLVEKTAGKYTINSRSSWYGSSGGSLTGVQPDGVDQSYMYSSGQGTPAAIASVWGIESDSVHAYAHVGSTNSGHSDYIYINVNNAFVDSIVPYNNTELIDLGTYYSGGDFNISVTGSTDAAVKLINSLILYELGEPVRSVKPTYTDTLFVHYTGNSITYYNGGQDSLLRQLTRYLTTKVYATRYAVNGSFMGGRWDTPAQDSIENGGHDFVVLQEYSNIPYLDSATYITQAIKWDSMVVANGGVPIHHMNHPQNADFDLYMDKINRVTTSIGDSTGHKVSPTGLAWDSIYDGTNYDDMYLDNVHPTYDMSYLNACMSYAAIFNKSPVGLPALLSTDAAYYQNVAWSIYSNYTGQEPTTPTVPATPSIRKRGKVIIVGGKFRITATGKIKIQ